MLGVRVMLFLSSGSPEMRNTIARMFAAGKEAHEPSL